MATRLTITDEVLRKEFSKATTIIKISDKDLGGFSIRYNPKTDAKGFFAQADQPRVNKDGMKGQPKPTSIKLGEPLLPVGHPDRMTSAKARDEAIKVKALIRAGTSFRYGGKFYPGGDAEKIAAEQTRKAIERHDGFTLRQGMERFFEKKTLKSEARMRQAMKRRFNDILDKPVSRLTAEYVDANYDVNHSTNDADFRVLRQIVNWLHRDKLSPKIDTDFREQMSLLMSEYKDTAEDLTIEKWHFPHIWAAMNEQDDPYADLLRFVMLTGMRRGEAARLEWERVSFNNDSYHIPDTKNGKPLYLHMTTFVKEMLQRRHEERDNWATKKYVFGAPSLIDGFIDTERGHGSVQFTNFRGCVNKLSQDELVRATPKQLRKLYGDTAEFLGVNSDVIRAIQNHAPAGVAAAHYRNRQRVTNKRIPMQQVEDYLLEHATAQAGDVRTFPLSATKVG